MRPYTLYKYVTIEAGFVICMAHHLQSADVISCFKENILFYSTFCKCLISFYSVDLNICYHQFVPGLITTSWTFFCFPLENFAWVPIDFDFYAFIQYRNKHLILTVNQSNHFVSAGYWLFEFSTTKNNCVHFT